MEHIHQTMTASAKQLQHEHDGGEDTHSHEEEGEVFQWIGMVSEVVEEEADGAGA